MDADLRRAIEKKVGGGERLSREDGVALFASDDLAWLGGLAHEVRSRRHGDAVHFTVNLRLDLSARCTEPCDCCARQGEPGEPGGCPDAPGEDAVTAHIEEAVRRARAAAPDGATELHVEGVAHPGLPWAAYPRALRALGATLPPLLLKAFSTADVHHFEQLTGRPAADLLDELSDAGLTSLTGFGPGSGSRSGAGARSGAGKDTSWDDHLRIHRLARAKGLMTPGTLHHGRGPAEAARYSTDCVDQVLRLRDVQDETGGLQLVAPLRPAVAVTGAEVLKTFAVCRLLLDNVPHLQASLPAHGQGTAQLALQHGADDIDAPLTRDDLLDLVRDTGFRPTERTTRHEVLRSYEGADPGRRDVPQPMRV